MIRRKIDERIGEDGEGEQMAEAEGRKKLKGP